MMKLWILRPPGNVCCSIIDCEGKAKYYVKILLPQEFQTRSLCDFCYHHYRKHLIFIVQARIIPQTLETHD